MTLNGLTLIPLALAAGYVLLCFFLGNLVLIDEARTAWLRRREKRLDRSRKILRFAQDYAEQLFPAKGGDRVIDEAEEAIKESKRLISKLRI